MNQNKIIDLQNQYQNLIIKSLNFWCTKKKKNPRESEWEYKKTKMTDPNDAYPVIKKKCLVGDKKGRDANKKGQTP